MNIFNKLLGFLLLATISIGCNKNSSAIEPDNEINIELDKRFIQFSSGISTRAALFEPLDNYLDSDFSALGYQYRGEWSAAKSMAKPNVFYHDDENTDLALPQLVTFNNGIYTYTPVKSWTGNKYSFFGYYPAQHSTLTLFDDGTVKEGVPYITYCHPESDNPVDLVDIMTASFIDTSIDFDSEVSMEMHHRLAAMDIRARNQYVYEEKVNDVTTINHLVTIEITNLVFKPVVYTKAKIYLDESPTVGSQTAELSYTIVHKEDGNNETPYWAHSTYDVLPNSATDMQLREITTSEGDNPTTLLFIPQNTAIGGTLELSYKMKYKDEDGNFIYLRNGEEVVIDPYPISNLNRILEEGYRYYIEITFTSDAVSVNIPAPDKWESLDEDPKIEFE